MLSVRLLRHLGLLCLLLALAAVGCNAGGESSATPSPAPAGTNTPAPVNTPAGALPTNTPAPTATVLTPLPSFTPIVRPTTSPPGDNTPVPGTAPAATTLPPTAGAASSTPAGTGGDLSFVYVLTWAISPDDPSLAIGTMVITPAGGDGTYSFFHDELPQPGPTFTFEWRTCTPKPGSLRVTSGDGQSLLIDYFEQAPCPATFTPTP